MTPRRRRRSPRREPDAQGANLPTLDLHGLTADEAVTTARRWLESQREVGEDIVALITGRGLHSAGPPVLPGAIRDLLSALSGGIVKSFDADVSGGAYRVHLIPPERSRHSVRTARTRVDPEVQREAEEALADLGVTPTKALLEAEIARILAERNEST